MRVLVVDDAIFMRHLLSGIFEKAGHTVCGEAKTGTEAIEKFNELKPDLVTMDVIMPDMNGVEAVKEIKRLSPDAHILIVSAMGQKSIISEVMKAGALDYVVKPFQSARILEALERVSV